MSEHTKGPWCREHSLLRAPNGLYVADVIAVDTESETEANANLIAAAPEILEALEALSEAVEGFCWCYACSPNGESNSDMCKIARAAIAKARGETP